MRVSEKAIVLQCVKRGDNKHIIKVFTEQHGLLSLSAVVSRAPSGKVRAAHILPLSLIRAEILMKQNREIHTLTESSLYQINNGIASSIQKLSIAQFINEVLLRSLKEQYTNPVLFEFIETCIGYLNDSEETFLNLPIYFLKEFCGHLGFEPQNNFGSHTPYFDCREGKFTEMSLPPPLGLTGPDSVVFSQFITAASLQAAYTNQQRRSITEMLLNYYKVHIPGFNELKSYTVLREVLAV